MYLLNIAHAADAEIMTSCNERPLTHLLTYLLKLNPANPDAGNRISGSKTGINNSLTNKSVNATEERKILDVMHTYNGAISRNRHSQSV